MDLLIRPASAADHAAITEVNRLAFGQQAEGNLVTALREGGYVRLSLVAEVEGQVVGHIHRPSGSLANGRRIHERRL